MRQHTIVIAEIGENHMGDMDMARRMVAEAAAAGADIVKFQSYRGVDVAEEDPEREWFSKVELSDEMHHELKSYAEDHGVEFLSSPFSLERARLLCEELGLKAIKIASSEMLNFPLLDYVNQHADTVFLSTGLSTLEEVEQAVSHLGQVKQCYILHCCTQYPTEDHQANLRAIPLLSMAFPGHAIGYSDHTLGIEAAAAAVAMGAQVVEKHFTLDKSLPGTDHILSVTPAELGEMVQRIRRVEVLLGRPVKQPVPEELDIREFVRGRWLKDRIGDS